MTILLVDSADADSAILASALRVEGFEVLAATSAKEAWEVLDRQSIAIAIIDLMLRNGGGNGLELAREIRGKHRATRVLLTSSYHLSERQLERADCGVSGFIPKPYDLREVVDFVRSKISGPPSSRRIWSAEPVSGITPRVIEPSGVIRHPLAPPPPSSRAVAADKK